MKPPATSIVDNLVWGSDGGVWAVWSATALPTAHQPLAAQLDVHSQLRSLMLSLPEHSMLLSICEKIEPAAISSRMVPRHSQPSWNETIDATEELLAEYGSLYERRYYVTARVGSCGPTTPLGRVRRSLEQLSTSFGADTAGPTADEIDRHSRAAAQITARVGSNNLDLRPVDAGELRWLYARALNREINEPVRSEKWNPTFGPTGGVLAQLTDAQCQEGGHKTDPDRPRHRRYMRVVTTGGQVGYQTVLAIADVPHEFFFPGGGECLYGAEQLPFPVDWCVRTRAVDNQAAKAKLLRQHRELVGQFGEYEGEVTGAPPELSEAVAGIEDLRTRLAAAPNEPELWCTVLFSIAAPDLVSLEDRVQALAGTFTPYEFGLGRPTGGQATLTRSFLPGTDAPAVCDDYRQYMTAGDFAGFGPFTAAQVGDPTGMLLGLSLDAGIPTPVLFDAAYGPKINSSASLVACGALGSGKSYFLKRLVADTVAQGGQVVTMDRTARREYAQLADGLDGVDCAVVDLTDTSKVSLDPLQSFTGDDRINVTLGFLQLLVGCATQSEQGTVLADAVHTVADDDPNARLVDVIDQLRDDPDPTGQGLARQLVHFATTGLGKLAFSPGGRGLPMDANLIVFSAPHLALPTEQTLTNEHLASKMLSEQIVGQAILYLVSAVSRHIVFSDHERFGAALYDEAAALLASPHGRQLVLEGITDGRKHNGAIWIASQHPNHFADPELVDLLGPRFVFRQDGRAAAAAMALLGADTNPHAEATLNSLTTGQCLFRDVRRRVGAIQILPPARPGLEAAFDTRPGEETERSEEQLTLDTSTFTPETVVAAEWRPATTRQEPATPDPVVEDERCPVVDLPERPDLAQVRARAWERRSNPLADALTDMSDS